MDNQTPVVLLRVDRNPGSGISHPRHLYPPLDLKYIQSSLNCAGSREVLLIDQWLTSKSTPNLLDQLRSYSPKIVVIKAASWCIEEALEIGQKLRCSNIITIAVGQQVSHHAINPISGWNEAYTLSVIGEPEKVVADVIRRIEDGHAVDGIQEELAKRLQSGDGYLVDIPDELPSPVFSEEELTRYAFPLPVPGKTARRWGYLMSAWGCPYQCDHCSEVVRKSSGSRLRLREPAKVVDEIERLISVGAEFISFEDDSFFCNRRHALAICDEIERRELKLAWITSSRVDELDEELIVRAKRAGLKLIKIGVESGSPEMIEQIGKCVNGELWLEKVRSVFSMLHVQDVGSVALFMLGMPGENVSNVEDSIRLARLIRPDYIQVQLYCDYPDTFSLGETKRNTDGEAQNKYHYQLPQFSCSRIPPEKLIQLQILFYRRFYFRFTYIVTHLFRCWRDYLEPQSILRTLPTLYRVARYIR